MKSICDLVGASITEKQETHKRTLHVFILKEFGSTLKNKGVQAIELRVYDQEIPQYEQLVFGLVGKKVDVIWDYAQYGAKLYSITEAK